MFGESFLSCCIQSIESQIRNTYNKSSTDPGVQYAPSRRTPPDVAAYVLQPDGTMATVRRVYTGYIHVHAHINIIHLMDVHVYALSIFLHSKIEVTLKS